jgi:hypothetical protein
VSLFTTHAIKRFVQRYVERLPSHPKALQRELARFRLYSRLSSWEWDGSQFRVIGSLAGNNYAGTSLLSHEEAETLIGGRLCARQGRFYRSAGVELGLWIVHWDDQTKERALTFLARGDSAEE